MLRALSIVAGGVLCAALISGQAKCQVSKQLEDRTKESQAAQEKSWKDVDQINKETDKTTTRLQESRKSSTESIQNARSPVKRTVVGTASPYAKPKTKAVKPKARKEAVTGKKIH